MDPARDVVVDRVRPLRSQAIDRVRSDDGREHVVDSRRSPQRSGHMPYERGSVSEETCCVSVRLVKCVSDHDLAGEVQGRALCTDQPRGLPSRSPIYISLWRPIPDLVRRSRGHVRRSYVDVVVAVTLFI